MTGIIVVGVDGSETALKAAQTARDLAVSLGEIGRASCRERVYVLV